MVARGASGVRGWGRKLLLLLFLFLFTCVRCSNQTGNYYTRGTGIIVRSEFFGFIIIILVLFLRYCYAVLCVISFRMYSTLKEEEKYTPYLG